MPRKRFTDADKWEDPWFCEQPSDVKLFWLYLCDRCDHGGVWVVNWRLAKFHLGDISPEALKSALGSRIREIDGGKKWFVPGFISFQYPTGLSQTSPAHKRIRSTISSHGINPDTLVYTLSNRVLDTPEDKEEDKDMYSKRESAEREIGPTPEELDLCRVQPSQGPPPEPRPVPRTFLDFRQGRGRIFVGKDKGDWEHTFKLYQWDACVAMYDALKERERIFYSDALGWLSENYELSEEDYANTKTP